MKLLFSIECNGLFRVEKENEVYSIWNLKTKQFTFYDNQGKLLPHYERPCVDNEHNYHQYLDTPTDEDHLIYNKYGVACGNKIVVKTEINKKRRILRLFCL